MNVPIAHSTESLERFLQHIVDNPTPYRVTVTYLKDAGFTTGNDPELRHIFRLLGFLGENDRPRKRWDQYKIEGKGILKTAVEESYKDLFLAIPDAALGRTDAELTIWFRPPITSNSRTSVIRAIRTFRKLCLLAGITTSGPLKPHEQEQNPLSSQVEDLVPLQPSGDRRQLVIQLPLSSDKSDYERMFEALKTVFYQ